MKKRWYSDSIQIGILGGGQLGRMLLQSAINLDIELHMMDEDPNAPCAKIAHSYTCGNIRDFDQVMRFGENKDIISVEIENVSVEALEELEKQGVKVFPQPRVLKIIRDKGLQKSFFRYVGLPTADFKLLDSLTDAKSVTIPFVHKLRTGGYDGKGVQVIQKAEDLAGSFDAPSIAEALIPFKKELAVIVARNENGQLATFPSVECQFNPTANLVELLFSPAEIDKEIEEQLKSIAIRTIEALDMVGILAVEFFLTEDNEILINEIAPRPHNSGHHTIECCKTSQFEQHLRAILNLPLGNTDLLQAGAMINLLGAEKHQGKVRYKGIEEAISVSGVHPHLYGKSTTKPFRKMGHVTITGKNIEEVKTKAKQIQGIITVISDQD